MNNQLNNDHYVYFLIDKNKKIRYIGHGRGDRVKRVDETTRGKEFLDILNDGGFVDIYADQLTKQEAMTIEANLLQPLMNGKYKLLINKNCGSYGVIYDPDYFNKFVEYSENSKTFLRWKDGTKNAGNDAGSIDKQSGYGQVRIENKLYYIHRIIMCLYYNTKLPHTYVVNHIDSNRSNNNFRNLEIVSHKENSLKNLNRKPGKSGVVGISRHIDNGHDTIVATVVLKDGSKKTKRKRVRVEIYEEQLKELLDWRRNILISEYGYSTEPANREDENVN